MRTRNYCWAALAAMLGFGATNVQSEGVVTSPDESAFDAALDGGGTVRLDFDGILTLTSGRVISQDTVIDASGRNVTISGGGATRLFSVESQARLDLVSLTVSNGYSYRGGAVSNMGVFAASGCVFQNNQAVGPDGTNGSDGGNGGTYGGDGQSGQPGVWARGGAVYSIAPGKLIFNLCVFNGNAALGGGGGDGGNGGDGTFGGDGGHGEVGGFAQGGAVYSSGSIAMTNCTVESNTARGGSGGTGGLAGAGVQAYNGEGGNGGQGSGGGVAALGTTIYENVTFAYNYGFGGAGGMIQTNGVTGNPPKNGSMGGASYGAAVFNRSTNLTVNCTFYQNKVTGGAGGNGGPNTEYVSGDGGDGGNAFGGAFYHSTNVPPTTIAALLNCTFATNRTVGGAGGAGGIGPVPGDAGGGGDADGGNLYRYAGSLRPTNSIIAGGVPNNAAGSILDGGCNISSDTTPSTFSAWQTTGTRTNSNPRLSALAANGGSTWTCAIASNSIAVNRGRSGAPPQDQRGLYRTYGPDIGSYEYNGATVPHAFVTIQAVDVYAAEYGTNTGVFAVTRTGKTNEQLFIGLGIAGTAVAGADYTALPANVLMAAGLIQTNIVVRPLSNAPVEIAKTIVVGLQSGTNYSLGLSTNAVVTLAGEGPLARAANSAGTWYLRGAGAAETHSAVAPLDGLAGAWRAEVEASSPYATRYHINGSSSQSQTNIANRIPFNTPIASFGRVYGSPLHVGQSYSIGISEGEPGADPVRIEVYSKASGAYQGVVAISQPSITNAVDWDSFATNGFARSGSGYGLTTILQGASDFSWGSGLGCWLLTHKATSAATNYVFLVCASGTSAGEPMVRDGTGASAPGYFYEMTFEERPLWRSMFVDQPHFQGEPLPSELWGKTPEELLNYNAVVTNSISLTSNQCLALDHSPEMRRHPVLDQFVADMSNDPVALANYVQNEIGLCDAVAFRDDGQVESETVNEGGVNRGAMGVFMEGQGSPVEQCALLVYLLRKAGYPATYAFPPEGGIKMLDRRLSSLLRLRINGAKDGYDLYYTTNRLITVNYPWVAAWAGNQWVHLFPWIKDTQVEEGLNVEDYLPAQYKETQLWVRDYVCGKANVMAFATPGQDTAAGVFRRFLESELNTTAPGISMDDLGMRCVNRRHLYAAWADFPRPTVVSNLCVAVESLGSAGITNVSARLTNIFDTVQVQLYSQMNPETEVWTPPMRMADLHNRKFFITHTNAGSGQYQAVLSLAAFSSSATGQGNFSAGDIGLTNSQVLTLALGPNDDRLGLRLRHRRQRALTWETALDPDRRFLDIVAPREVLVERPLRKGEVAAICFNAGRVTPAMLRVHAEELWSMERQLSANPALADQMPRATYQGALLYLMGMSYYERCSREDAFLRDLFKVQSGSDFAMGLAKLSPLRGAGGVLPDGEIDPVWPNVDMFFHEMVRIGNGTVRTDSGRDLDSSTRNYSAVSLADVSSQEHAAIDSFFGQSGSVSTVKLLQLAQADAAYGGAGVVKLTSKNYLVKGYTHYNGMALKNHSPSMWAEIARIFQNDEPGYVVGWVTPGNMATASGSFSGMGAMMLGVWEQAALIGNNQYGAYGEPLPPGTIAAENTTAFQLTGTESGYQMSFSTPQAGAPQGAPESLALYDWPQALSWLGNGAYVGNPYQEQLGVMGGFVLNGSEGSYGTVAPEMTDSGLFALKPDNKAGFGQWVADPVNALTGEFYVDEVDMALPGPMPLEMRRNYGSQNLAGTQLGYGWKLNYMPHLAAAADNVFYAAEQDGSVLAFGPVAENLWAPTLALNPTLNNNSGGIGSVANRLNARLAKTGTTYYLTNSDGSLRVFEEMSFPLAASVDLDRLRPYLTKWLDNRGNFYAFEYGTNATRADYGQVRRVTSSSGNILRFEFDVYGRIVEAYSLDGRRLQYTYDAHGDLVRVTRPDASELAYAYKHETWEHGEYSTHLLVREGKPDGRALVNEYDSQRRVTNQWATVGPDLRLVRNATFRYTNDFNLTNLTATITGSTTLLDYTNNATTYYYTNGLIRRIRDPLGAEVAQQWYEQNETSAPAYPRSLKTVTDKRGLVTSYYYDERGNATNVTVRGDLRGDGDMNATAVTTTVFNGNNLPEKTVSPSGATNLFFYTNGWLLARSEFWPGNATAAQAVTNLFGYTSVTNADGTASHGLRWLEVRAAYSAEAATNEVGFSSRGFPARVVRHTGTGDPAVVVTNVFNTRGELVQTINPQRSTINFSYTPGGNPQSKEVYEAGQSAPVGWEYSYYNDNGELTWSDGPRYNPEDYVWRDYDGAGRQTQELRWRSQGRPDGSSVEAPDEDHLYAASFNEFDPFGNLTKTVDPLGNYSVRKHDAIGQLLREEFYSAQGTLLATNGFAYNLAGDVTNSWNALGGSAQRLLTSTGKPKFLRNPDGSTNAWLYLNDGRLHREYQRNGAFWEFTYNGAARITTKVFHSASGSPLATNSTMLDRRGNIAQTVDALGNVFTNYFDGLDRVKFAAGPLMTNVILSGIPPVSLTNVSRQSATHIYDAAGKTNVVVNALGEKVVSTRDALGRETGLMIYASNAVTPVRVSQKVYSADHHAITEWEGTGNSSIPTLLMTDNDGRNALTLRYPTYPSAEAIEVAWQGYDLAGNRTAQQTASWSNTVFTVWSTNGWTYDGLNRSRTETMRDGATTTYSRDALGSVTNRAMPGGIQWSASYSSAGQMLSECDSASGQTTRNTGYAYYSAGEPWAGLLKAVTDGRGVSRTNAYNEWLDTATITTTGPLDEQKQTVTWGYDARRQPTNISQSFAVSGAGPSAVVRRGYNSLRQILSENVALDGNIVWAATQQWNVAGRRTQLAFGSWSAAFQYRADGLLSAVNDAAFGYGDTGLLLGRTNAFRSVTIDQRDGAGRVKQATTRAGVSTAMVESWQYTGDGLPSLYNAVRSDFADTRRFAYGTAHRRLMSETLNLSGSQSITNVYEFDQGQAGGLGVMTLANQSGAFAGNWNVASTNQDAFKRVTGERSTTLNRIARGTVNGPATLTGNINGRPLDLRYNPATGGEWSAQLDLAAGQNTLTLYAAHPSGQFTTNKASSFTVHTNAADAVETKFDAGGYVTNRIWRDSQGTVLRAQNLVWDAFGRLVKQTERDSGNNGYNWQTDLDPLGRRARTITTPVTNGVALNSQQRTINHFYDPQVEFLEVGVSINGSTTWKTYGPDLDGVYGGQQGLGGLETLTSSSTPVGVVQDGFGNVLGSAKNATVTWNTARVGLYGPVEGYPVLSLSTGPLTTEHLAYRGKWRDEAGFYYWGARPYDSDRRAFLSFDTLGHGATPDGYSAFNGRPSDIWDPDARLATQVAQEGGRQMLGVGGFLADTALNTVYGGGMALNWAAGAAMELTGGNGEPFYAQADQWKSYMSPYEHMGSYDSQSPGAQLGMAATIVLSPESLAGRLGSVERAFAAEGAEILALPPIRQAAGGLVIGRGAELSRPFTLAENEFRLTWPATSTTRSEWKMNSGLLRREMRTGVPIRDASPGNVGGMYLNAERNLLESRGWNYNSSTGYWHPPVD